MSENYEVAPVSNNAESGEASSEAVEQMAEQMREAAAAASRQAKQEGKAKKIDQAVVELLVKTLQGSHDPHFLKLIVASLQENTPPSLVLATISPIYEDVFKDLPAKGEGLFVDETWPEEERKKMQQWEKILLTSLEGQEEKFHKVLNENDGSLPSFSELLDLIIQKVSNHNTVSGVHILNALIEHTNPSEEA